MSKDRRLGRGLAALLGSPEIEAPVVTSSDGTPRLHDPDASTLMGEKSKGRIDDVQAGQIGESSHDSAAGSTGRELLLSVSLIEVNPFQPRREFGESEIVSLAESLKEHDLLQPVLVRRIGTSYQLISGERRLRAARRAGWKKIPARIREADDRLVAELAIVENLQRKDLNAIEKALSFQRYLQQHDCTQDDLGKRLKIDRSTIANLMRLLELPEEVQKALQENQITAGHARALLPLGDRREQIRFCDRIQTEGMTVRDTERLVSESIDRDGTGSLSMAAGKSGKNRRTKSGHIASLEQDLRRALGAKVEIKPGSSGRGKIVLHFRSNDEFERLRALLMEEDPRQAARA